MILFIKIVVEVMVERFWTPVGSPLIELFSQVHYNFLQSFFIEKGFLATFIIFRFTTAKSVVVVALKLDDTNKITFDFLIKKG
ncbi:hypothetical protein CR194_05200 [Salipaludibacillus keqinensis]|uniref:Uncharacterized protein n=1 Tax=Salipaludibacillus keqinensis TaxID=2045207 RepID=A0A323TJ17_9BACI|nr:hypothetical protein CR194_05200 [Salipaludibacillus keqinensis]